MKAPLECHVCEKEASFMCTKRGCLKLFCDICPLCPTGSCNNEDHRNMCWKSHLPPPWSKDTRTHEKCALEDQRFVSEMLYREEDPERQKILHHEDRKALWFIVEPGEEVLVSYDTDETINCNGTLYVTNRLSRILTKDTLLGEHHQSRFPTLVSFIGETGAGKSTLIRALLKESYGRIGNLTNQRPEIECPVVQASSTESLAHPTSSGVHLYQDPRTSSSSHPILFADCEGFNAGGISAASFPQDLATDENVLAKFKMTAHSYTTSVENEDLYAKSLYTFSDCVCFVIKNAQTVAKSMERLLVWAAKGSGTAIHVLPQKSLTLILNPQSQHNNDIMDQKTLREIFLSDHMTFWKDNQMLNRIKNAAFRDTPVTPERFLHLYFSTVNVFYIPDGSRAGVVHPSDIRLQISKLYTQISNDVESIADIRQLTWTLYSEKDFTRLFYLSLQHFATTDEVFNFFEATKSTSLDHRGLEGHILALRRQFTSTTDANRQTRFPPVVASALVNKVLREDIANFNKELQWKKCHQACEKGIDRFYKQFRTCEFSEKGIKCIQTFNLHGPSHIAKDGRIIKSGDFHLQIEEIEKIINLETAEVKAQFMKQYVEIFQNEQNKGYPALASIVRHRKNILRQAYNRNSPLYSYRTCFACLHGVPDHVLPCGHAICETCATDFGSIVVGQVGAYRLDSCIFDGQQWIGKEAQIIKTKPLAAGVRVLTLDGGGIRGILQVAILGLLSEMIGLDLHISHFFDLIVGTSTGGLIALGLGVKQMNPLDIEENFINLATKTFGAMRGGVALGIGVLTIAAAAAVELPILILAGGIMLVTGWGANVIYKQSLYKTGPLRNGIQGLLGTETSIFGNSIRQRKQRSTRVAVMCMKDPTKVSVIANYNRPFTDSLSAVESFPDDFERAENEEEEIKAWEAYVYLILKGMICSSDLVSRRALATSAAPPYLKPFIKASSKKIYFNGERGHKDPVFWATKEFRKIWDRPELEAKLDAIVSIGSGTFPPISPINGAILPEETDPNPMMTLLVSTINQLQGEKALDDSVLSRIQYSEVSHRLNVIMDGIRCDFSDCQTIPILLLAFNKIIVQQDQQLIPITNPPGVNQSLREKINLVAHLLVAKLFFFEPMGPVTLIKGTPNSTSIFQIEGKILCRLPQGSSHLRKLVTRIVAFSAIESENERELYQIAKTDTRERMSNIDIRGVKEAVMRGGVFEVNHKITTSNPGENFQAICVELKHAAVVPQLKVGHEGEESEKITLGYISDKLAISGFPRKISGLTKRSLTADRSDWL